MARVSIIGSGNVGANTAFFIAEKGIEDVLLYDIREGLSTGKALDMMEAAPIRKYRNRITGTDSLEDIKGSEVVLITAGSVRKPGLKREDLFEENSGIIAGLAPKIAELAPESTVVIVTEPIDMITTVFQRQSGMPRTRVLGLSTCIDSVRFRYLVAKELNISTENVSTLIIGRHSNGFIGLPRYCSISGIPLTEVMPEERINALLEETRNMGNLIVELAQRSSAYYAPSAVAAELVDALHMDLGRVFSVSLMTGGEYGVSGVALGLPAIVGKHGVQQILTPELTDLELKRFRDSAHDLQTSLSGRMR